MHIRTISAQISKKEKYDENIDIALNIIAETEKKGLPKWQTRKLYLDVCEKVLQNVELKQSTKQELESFNNM
jgi:CRISPR/Cas system CSM-associated protein Csm2 small subunit